MDQGWWAGFVLQSGEVTLEQCAAAVWALNGVETSEGTCMGDYFYFEWGYVSSASDGSGSDGACASDRLSRARRPGAAERVGAA